MMISTRGRYALRLMIDLAETILTVSHRFGKSLPVRKSLKNIWRELLNPWFSPASLPDFAAKKADTV